MITTKKTDTENTKETVTEDTEKKMGNRIKAWYYKENQQTQRKTTRERGNKSYKTKDIINKMATVKSFLLVISSNVNG